MHRSAVLVFAALAVVGCTGEPSTQVTIERARASFCEHAPAMRAALAGQPVAGVNAAAALASDASLYEQAGQEETAASLDRIMSAIGVPVPMIRVYLTSGVDRADRSAIERRLLAMPGATKATYTSQDANYQLFLQMFEGQPSVIANVRPKDIPASFDLVVVDGTDVDALAGDVDAIEGVRRAIPAGPIAQGDVMAQVNALIDQECPGLRDTLGLPSG